MKLIMERPTPGQLQGYHIKIVGANKRCGKQKIDDFLNDLFDIDTENGRWSGLENSPLEFSRQALDTPDGSPPTLLIQFELTAEAQNADITLDRAAERFCELMFHPEASNYLGNLSKYCLLGVSALPGPFETYWIQTFFKHWMEDQPRLLDTVDGAFEGSYLSEWALVLSFAVVEGLGSESVVSRAGSYATAALRRVSARTGLKILEEYTANRENSVTGENQEYDFDPDKLVVYTNDVSNMFKEVEELTTIGSEYHRLHGGLCIALYKVMCETVKAVTANTATLNDFKKKHDAANLGIARAGVASVTSTGSFGSMAYLAATNQARLTMTLTRAAALIPGFETLLASSPALGAAMPYIVPVASCVVVGFLGYGLCGLIKRFWREGTLSWQERQESTKGIKHHTEVGNAIEWAGQLAKETHTFLRMLHLMDGSVPDSARSIDSGAQSEWNQFLESIEAATGTTVTNANLTPQIVLKYLSEQSKSWKKACAKINPVDNTVGEEGSSA